MKNKQRNLNKIPLFKVFMSSGVMNPLKKVLNSGYIGQGSQVNKLEQKLADFIGMPYMISVNSGTSAIHLALRLIGIQPGDEIISTPMTCTATNWPMLSFGAKIVWADIDPLTGNIDPGSIKNLVSKKTKAIMVVDWGGYPCDIDEVKKIAPEIPIIEDAAHAFGATYKSKTVGQSADYTCFSFQAIKHVTAGDGGVLVVKKKHDYNRGTLLRWYGIDRNRRSQENRIEIDIKEWGYKFNMNDINATIALENMKYVDEILKKHRENASYYKTHLANLRKITLLKEKVDYISSYWLFTILVKNRTKFAKYMSNKNIAVSQVHRRNDTHSAVKEFRSNLPGVDVFTKSMVCIPVGWWVNRKERQYIVNSIVQYS